MGIVFAVILMLCERRLFIDIIFLARMSCNSESSEAFNVLRPYCVGFIQKRDLKSVECLHAQLVTVNKDALDDVAPYVLFPFQVLLKTQKSPKEDLLICSLQCLSYIFSNSYVRDWKIANEFLTSISKLVSDEDHQGQVRGSEELKHATANVFLALFDKGVCVVNKLLYHYTSIPLLGHVVTILLSFSQENIDRNARISALQALLSLCNPSYCKAFDEGEQNIVKTQIADAMACFLPGVSSSLMKIITNPSAGQKVRSFSMKVLGTFIVTVLGDSSPNLERPLGEDIHPKLKSLIITRDENWIKQAVEKLGKIMEKVCSSSNSDEFAVRMSCVEFCRQVLLQCMKNIGNHVVILLNVPVKLMNDEYPKLRKLCNTVLGEFSTKIQNDDSKSRVLSQILEENLYVLSTRLPRIMRSGDDAEKLSNLKIYSGYITILKNQITKLIMSLPHLSKLGNALLHCFELDMSSVQLLDVSASEMTSSEMMKSCFRKRFKNFCDNKVYTVLIEICMNLGKYGDVEILTDYFMDIYNTSETHCKQSVLIILEILCGATNDDGKNEKLSEIIQSMQDEFLSQENWYLVTNFDSEYFGTHHKSRMKKLGQTNQSSSLMPMTSSSFQDLSSKFIKNNILLCCLHLDAILIFSKILKTNFRGLLMHALYPILEKTADSDDSLSACAVRALGGIALHCGYRSTSELIARNADYLISDISIQIHKLNIFPRCPAVLRAILNHSDSNILPLVYDTVDEIVEALDQHHLEPKKLLIFIPVLLSVVNGVNRWMKENSAKSNDESAQQDSRSETAGLNMAGNSLHPALGLGNSDKKRTKDHPSFIDNLKKELLERHKANRIASMEAEPKVDPDWKPEDAEDDHYSNLEDEKKPDKPPMEIQVVTKVMTRCLHLMANADPRVRMRIMEVVESGVLALSKVENELLPMAHKLWNPLIVRFTDKESQVVMKAFDTLCIIGAHAKDFLRKRFCKDILPKLLSILGYHASYSKRITISHGDNIKLPMGFTNKPQNSIAYKHSVAFKLQRNVLYGLGPLLQDLDVKRNDHILVCKSLIQYLSNRQPAELQEATVNLFRHLIKIDIDLTWLEITRVWCHESVVCPKGVSGDSQVSKSLKNIYLGRSNDSNSEYASNCKKLLKECA